jgi:hypothetical protein
MGHVGIVVQVRVVLGFFLDDAEETGRRLASALSRGHRRSQDPTLCVVNRDLLAPQRDDCHDRLAGGARLDRGYRPLAPTACGTSPAAIIR